MDRPRQAPLTTTLKNKIRKFIVSKLVINKNLIEIIMVININSRSSKKQTKWLRVQIKLISIRKALIIKKNWNELSKIIFINTIFCKKIIIAF